MNRSKILLLVFVFACVSGIVFTYSLYHYQSQGHRMYSKGVHTTPPPSYKPPKPPPPEDPNAPVRPSKFLEQDIRLELAKNSPRQEMHRVQALQAQTQIQKATLARQIVCSDRLCEDIRHYAKGAQTQDILLQKLAFNLLASFEKKQKQAKSDLEGLETQRSELNDTLEELKQNFLRT